MPRLTAEQYAARKPRPPFREGRYIQPCGVWAALKAHLSDEPEGYSLSKAAFMLGAAEALTLHPLDGRTAINDEAMEHWNTLGHNTVAGKFWLTKGNRAQAWNYALERFDVLDARHG